MSEKIRNFLQILKTTVKKWWDNDPFRQSATIAYYAIFSLPALLVLIINFVGLFYEREAISVEISRQIKSLMGEDAATAVAKIVEATGKGEGGLLSGIIAVITIFLGAVGVFVQLQKTLNTIWGVKQKPHIGILQTLKTRLFSFGLILTIGFLLMVSLVVSTALAAFGHWLESIFTEAVAYLFYVLDFALSLTVISTLFALMFKFLPDAKMRWKGVWVGAFMTGFLFILGKYGLSLYFGKAEPASVYGAAGSVVLILLWTSYSSMIVFFGAEFTKQFASFHHMKISPTSIAEKKEDDVNVVDSKEQTSADQKPQKERIIVKYNGEAEKNKKSVLIKHNGQNKKTKLKSLEELSLMISELELRLEQDKEGIIDNLKPSHLFAAFIPKSFRLKESKQKRLVDIYLKHVANKHISLQSETFMDKVKKFILDGDGSEL